MHRRPPLHMMSLLVGVLALPSGCSTSSLPANTTGAHVLSAAQAGPETPIGPLTSTAHTADGFVAGLGVDTHFSYANTVYGYLTKPAPSGYSVLSALKSLGIRHLRDGNIDTDPQYCPAFKTAIASGTDVDSIATTTTTVAGLKSIATCLGAGFFAVEGPNELDNSGDPTWPADDVAAMQTLHVARGSAFPMSVKLFGPSLTSEASYIALAAVNGDAIKNEVDDVNSHVYLSGRWPETPGWGGTDQFGTYGAITTTRNWAVETVSTAKPWVATETGYPDNPADSGYVPAAIKSKYLVRDLLQMYRDGASETYIYELADENGSWGLMDDQLNPKPAFTAIKNLISILGDPGAAITPGILVFSIAAPSDVQHLLFEKRDGSFWICLWQDDSGWNPNTNAVITVKPANVTITFGSVPSAIKKYPIDATDGTVTPVSITPATAISLVVSDSPTIVQVGKTAKTPIVVSVKGASRY